LFVHAGVTHLPFKQPPPAQSVVAMQVLPSMHLLHWFPPQSMSVSLPSLTAFLQLSGSTLASASFDASLALPASRRGFVSDRPPTPGRSPPLLQAEMVAAMMDAPRKTAVKMDRHEARMPSSVSTGWARLNRGSREIFETPSAPLFRCARRRADRPEQASQLYQHGMPVRYLKRRFDARVEGVLEALVNVGFRCGQH
jgi:hypothetical protein